MKKHPDKTLYELLPIYFGPYLGTLGNVLVCLYGALATFTVIFTTLFVINVWILVETPNYLILAGYLIPAYIIGSNGIQVIREIFRDYFLSCHLDADPTFRSFERSKCVASFTSIKRGMVACVFCRKKYNRIFFRI